MTSVRGPQAGETARKLSPGSASVGTMPTERPNTNLAAPVGSVDLAAFESDGTPISFRPCQECAPWHAEVMNKDGYVFVREWHAIDCKTFRMLTEKVTRER